MKIKEKYSEAFLPAKKEDLDKFGEDLRVIRMGHKYDLLGLVDVDTSEDLEKLVFGNYYITSNVFRNDDDILVYLQLNIPAPKTEATKDIFLKYHNGAKHFLEKFLEVLEGKIDDINPIYTEKQKKDLKYDIDDDDIVFFELENEESCFFGFVDFPSKEMNLRVAKNFIKHFEGIPIESSWEEICEQ